MKDPVMTRNDISYERDAVFEYIRRCEANGDAAFCVVTGNPLTVKEIKSNSALKLKIQFWLSKHENDKQTSVNNMSSKRVIPERFVCQLSGEVMVDPVMTKYGDSFERRPLHAFVDKHGVCPRTGKALNSSGIVSNHKLQQEISFFMNPPRLVSVEEQEEEASVVVNDVRPRALPTKALNTDFPRISVENLSLSSLKHHIRLEVSGVDTRSSMKQNTMGLSSILDDVEQTLAAH